MVVDASWPWKLTGRSRSTLSSHFPRVLCRSHVLHASVAGERDGRDHQGGRVREMQSPASRAGPAHRRGQVQRRARAVPGQRTLHTDHGGPEQLHIPHAQRPHGRAGELLEPRSEGNLSKTNDNIQPEKWKTVMSVVIIVIGGVTRRRIC